jgi:hypothetical protein
MIEKAITMTNIRKVFIISVIFIADLCFFDNSGTAALFY